MRHLNLFRGEMKAEQYPYASQELAGSGATGSWGWAEHARTGGLHVGFGAWHDCFWIKYLGDMIRQYLIGWNMYLDHPKFSLNWWNIFMFFKVLKALASPPRIFEWAPWVPCGGMTHGHPVFTWLLDVAGECVELLHWGFHSHGGYPLIAGWLIMENPWKSYNKCITWGYRHFFWGDGRLNCLRVTEAGHLRETPQVDRAGAEEPALGRLGTWGWGFLASGNFT